MKKASIYLRQSSSSGISSGGMRTFEPGPNEMGGRAGSSSSSTTGSLVSRLKDALFRRYGANDPRSVKAICHMDKLAYQFPSRRLLSSLEDPRDPLADKNQESTPPARALVEAVQPGWGRRFVGDTAGQEQKHEEEP